MKTLFLKGLVLCLMLFTLGCESQLSLDDLSSNDFNGDLPESTQVFIQTEYQGYEIYNIELDDFCDDVELYEVELEDGPGPDVDLYFDLDWNFVFSTQEISRQTLPAEVLNALAAHPDYPFEEDDWEVLNYADGTIRYTVELEKDRSDERLELIVNTDGSIYCTDEDEDEDEDDDDDENKDKDKDNGNDENSNDKQLPTQVLAFIESNHQGYAIEEISKEDFCYDQDYYEVELEDGPGPDLYLYFSLDWTYLFSLKEIDEDELTAAINRVLETNYGDYSIEDDEVYKLSYPDGTKKYFLELEKDEDADLEIIFNSDGSVDCVETDD